MTADGELSLPQLAAQTGGWARGPEYCPACLSKNGYGVGQALLDDRHPRCAAILDGEPS